MALNLIAACAITAGLSAALTAGLLRWRIPIEDVPNPRSSHDRPKSQSGGIALFVSIMSGAAIYALADGSGIPLGGWLVFGAVYFFTLGLLDDILRLPEWLRFVSQLAFASAFAIWGLRLHALDLPGLALDMPSAVSLPLTIFWYVGYINLFNFMDGIDGIAGAEAAFVGLLMCVVSNFPWPLIISASAVGFLFYNYQPSKIFMGNSGSYLLGFLLAALSVRGSFEEGIPFPVFVLFSGTFIADTTVTLIRRMVRGECWYKAHRSHYYQKLTDLGFTHSQVTLLYMALTLLFGGAGLLYVHCVPSFQWLILAACCAVWGAAVFLIHRAETSAESAEKRN